MKTINDQITEMCKPLMDKEMLDAYTQHMARAPEGTTTVDPANLPTQNLFEPPEKLLNLPATLEDAIARLRVVETALDDLNRASEIAEYSGQFEILSSFRDVANQILETKITVDHSTPTEMNITIVS